MSLSGQYAQLSHSPLNQCNSNKRISLKLPAMISYQISLAYRLDCNSLLELIRNLIPSLLHWTSPLTPCRSSYDLFAGCNKLTAAVRSSQT